MYLNVINNKHQHCVIGGRGEFCIEISVTSDGKLMVFGYDSFEPGDEEEPAICFDGSIINKSSDGDNYEQI